MTVAAVVRRRRCRTPSSTSYYGRPVVKPAPWEHDIPAYLFLGGVAAGSALLGAGGAATGLPALRRAAGSPRSRPWRSAAAPSCRPRQAERVLNMLRTVKLTSPMSVGTWILAALQRLRRRVTPAAELAGCSRSVPAGPARRGPARLGRGGARRPRIGPALFAPPLAAYTAVLLADTATPTVVRRVVPRAARSSSSARRPWPRPGCRWSCRRSRRRAGTSPRADRGRQRPRGDAADGVAARRGRRARTDGDRVRRQDAADGQGAHHRRGSRGRCLSGRSRAVALAAGTALAAASALTRFGVVDAGIESAKDPKYTVDLQKARLEKRRPEARSTTASSRCGDVRRIMEEAV